MKPVVHGILNVLVQLADPFIVTMNSKMGFVAEALGQLVKDNEDQLPDVKAL